MYDMKNKEQLIYKGHVDEIICMAIHAKGNLIATGDISSNIHIWSSVTMICQCIIQVCMFGCVRVYG